MHQDYFAPSTIFALIGSKAQALKYIKHLILKKKIFLTITEIQLVARLIIILFQKILTVKAKAMKMVPDLEQNNIGLYY